MKKKSLAFKISVGVAIVLVVAIAFGFGPVTRLLKVMNLFKPDVITSNFQHMDSIFEAETLPKSNNPFHFEAAPQSLPATFPYKGENKVTDQFLEETDTTGLLVLKDGKIAFESYYRGAKPDSKMISWSMSKSMVSALFGIAMKEGFIKDLNEPVDAYIPELKGTGYEGIKIIDVMQMSSGIQFDENYADSNSDINRMGRVLALNTSIDDFVRSLKKGTEPGKILHYVSMDTQVLATILRESLKKKGIGFNQYFEEKLWSKLGPESEAFWLLDSRKMELAFGGFNATVRDYAKFGQLYLNGGKWNGDQIVPEDWVKVSTTATKPHLLPGKELSKSGLGYGYQWWLPFNNDGDFVALGIYSQYIYVYPKYNTVVVKTSAYKNYNKDGGEKIAESIEFFRQIAKSLK